MRTNRSCSVFARDHGQSSRFCRICCPLVQASRGDQSQCVAAELIAVDMGQSDHVMVKKATRRSLYQQRSKCAILEARPDICSRKRREVFMDNFVNTPITNRSKPPGVAIPVLGYEHVDEAVRWLCDVFGFTLHLGIGSHRVQLLVNNGLGGEGSVVATERGEHAPAEGSHSVLVQV